MSSPHLFLSPRGILHGGGSLLKGMSTALQIGGVLAHTPRVLVVTDPFLHSSALFPRLEEALHSAGAQYHVWSDTQEDPTDQVVLRGLEVFRQKGPFDAIVAFGGGSPMDTCKAMNALGAQKQKPLRDMKVPYQVTDRLVPLVAIPTTAGTGSEVTRFCVITDTQHDEKMLIAGPGCVPDVAIVDFELSMTQPPRLTADTGIDSLTHAIEAYVSKKRNHMSDVFALSAMSRINRNIRVAFSEPGNRHAREQMMLGAMEGGLAFGNASVCLVHGMSRPLGAFFHVPHGLSNAMLLPLVTEFSLSSCVDRYADCARCMGVASSNDSHEEAAHKLLDSLKCLNADLQVPTPADFGIDPARFQEVLGTMADQALASGSPSNNPRVPSQEEIIALFQKSFHGAAL